MKKEISLKGQLIILIVLISFICTVWIVVITVLIHEEIEERQTVADAYIRTEAYVTEAGEVRKSTGGRGAVGWSQRCVIKYQLPDGKTGQTTYLVTERKEYSPLECGEKIEVLVSPLYQDVKSARIESPTYIPMMIFWTVVGVVIFGGLIAVSVKEYRRRTTDKT